jgi:leucyl/phenylalanyl-tRNA--protein transferase
VNQSRIAWLSPSDPPASFPDVSQALTEPDGLLAAGGDLGVARLLAAYTKGIFPWFEDGQPILWWSPNPRCILWPAKMHVPRRLRQQARSSTSELRFNTAFEAVIRACAGKRRSQQGTWITSDMISAYTHLHREGWAHSVEIWDKHGLAGGLYGLCIGKVFFGESMFSAQPNTSKMAMLGLTRHMQATGIELLDCQVPSPHLFTMGAEFMPREDFSAFLAAACNPPEQHLAWPDEPEPVSRLFIA